MKMLSSEVKTLLDKLYNLRGEDSVILAKMNKEREEAIETGKDLVCLLHGIPPGFEMAIYKRMNAYVLVSNPKSY